MAFIVESFSGTSDHFRYSLGTEGFKEEKAARKFAAEQMINEMAETVMVYEGYCEAVDDDGCESTR